MNTEEKKSNQDSTNHKKSNGPYRTIIDQLKIENYKAISKADLDCQAINLIIGENGTGKSSIFEIISYLTKKGNGAIKSNLIEFGDYEDLFPAKDDKKTMRFFCKFNIPLGLKKHNEQSTSIIFAENLSYQIEIYKDYTNENAYRVQIEGNIGNFCYWSLVNTFKKAYQSRSSTSPDVGKVLEYMNKKMIGKEGKEFTKFSTHHMRFEGVWEGIAEFSALIKDEMLRLRLRFNLEDYIPSVYLIPAERNLNYWEYRSKEEVPKRINLTDSGQSLAIYLSYKQKREDREFWDQVEYWMNKFSLSDFQVVPEEYNTIVLDIIDTRTDAEVKIKALGSGMNQLVGVIVKCLLAEKGEILLIEEPEIHLHPKFQAKIMDLLLETAKRGVQVFITTHSEYLLLRLQRAIAEEKIFIENVAIFEMKRKNGYSISSKVEIEENGLFKEGLPSFATHTNSEFQRLEESLNKRKEKAKE